jgi:plasmid stabilization system protein ParE
MIRIRISDDALCDLQDGFLFYEAQEEGLGDYFAASLRSDIESLRISAGTHRVVYRDYHRLLSRVFPYGVFYTYSTGEAVVWAVMDLRRDPD